jgi:hypothetical protein
MYIPYDLCKFQYSKGGSYFIFSLVGFCIYGISVAGWVRAIIAWLGLVWLLPLHGWAFCIFDWTGCAFIRHGNLIILDRRMGLV